MQLVFVHGVATRAEPDKAAYERQVAERQAWFRDVCLEGSDVHFHDPYWGSEGISATRTFLSIPLGPGVPLALGGEGLASTQADPAGATGSDLLQAARSDFDGMLNSLSIELCFDGSAEARRVALLIGGYAAERDATAKGGGAPAWLDDGSVRNDAELLARLRTEVGAGTGATTLGLSDTLRAAGSRILGGAVGVVDGPIERMVRRLSPQIGLFLGDVFTYLREGAPRTSIRNKIGDALVGAAVASRGGGGNLVVVGHSMGAIILHDMLTDPVMIDELEGRIGAPLAIDLLLTVGTQVGLFQELRLFDRGGTVAAADRPRNAQRWWHVYNVMDVLSFGVDGVFGGVEQFSVNTQANILDAHGAYFRSPVFHRRLRRRMKLAGLIA